MTRTDLDVSWVDSFLPSLDGIALKEKREAGKAPGAKRAVNEGSAKKLLKTPEDAEEDVEDTTPDDENGEVPSKHHSKKPPKGSIVKVRM